MAADSPLEREPVDEFRMRQMLEHLPFFAIMIDRERRYVWVNRLDPTLTPDQVRGRLVILSEPANPGRGRGRGRGR